MLSALFLMTHSILISVFSATELHKPHGVKSGDYNVRKLSENNNMFLHLSKQHSN